MSGSITCVYRLLKQKYCMLGAEWRIERFWKDSNKILRPLREEIIKRLRKAWKSLETNEAEVGKQKFLTSVYGDFEDYRVRNKLYSRCLKRWFFWEELRNSTPQKFLQDLLKKITSPKGVHKNALSELSDLEGKELKKDEIESFCCDKDDADRNVEQTWNETILKEVENLVKEMTQTEQKSFLGSLWTRCRYKKRCFHTWYCFKIMNVYRYRVNDAEAATGGVL